MIEVKNLNTGYVKDKPLLKNFNYMFDTNIYGILGPSGCGKTTLLRTIAGLTKPLSGEVFVDGMQVKKPNKSGIYMLHQNYTSFDWLNCLDNVLIAKKIQGNITDEDIYNAKQMLELVRLSECSEKYPRQLSGGMKQRLALARTLFVNPKIILMDEPLSALDGKTRNEMQDLILDIHKHTKNTILMITHSIEEADKMCDKTIKLWED